jgi:Thioredoxin-like
LKPAAFRILAAFAFAAIVRADENPVSARPPVVPFLEDDYGKALTAARIGDRPLFVAVCAPWCTACRAMRAFVFTDPALASFAGRFVWLSIDTARKSNAPFLLRYPGASAPALLVVDAKTEAVALSWAGAATADQLAGILKEGRRAARGDDEGLDRTLTQADRLAAGNRPAEAAAAYRRAIAEAPAKGKSDARAVRSLLAVLARQREFSACAAAARDALARLADSPSAADVARRGVDCALAMPPSDAARPGLLAALSAGARRVLARPSSGVAAEEVSSLYRSLAREREAAGDASGRTELLRDWAGFLEAQAARGKTPHERAVFDADRLAAYVGLGQPQRAIAMLEASSDAFEEDAEPSSRLALAYEAMKNYEMALMASDKALSKAYGPWLVSLLEDRSRICRENRDLVSAKIALEEAVRESEALPAGMRSEDRIEALRRKIGELPPPGP